MRISLSQISCWSLSGSSNLFLLRLCIWFSPRRLCHAFSLRIEWNRKKFYIMYVNYVRLVRKYYSPSADLSVLLEKSKSEGDIEESTLKSSSRNTPLIFENSGLSVVSADQQLVISQFNFSEYQEAFFFTFGRYPFSKTNSRKSSAVRSSYGISKLHNCHKTKP